MKHCGPFRGLFVLSVCIGLATGPAKADNTRQIVIFRDGFDIQGKKVAEDKEVIVESGQPLVIAKGTFTVDANARIYSFSVKQVADVIKKDPLPTETIAWPPQRWFNPRGVNVNPIYQVEVVHPFDSHWNRDVRLYGNSKLFRQRLMRLTPQFAEVYALDWRWRSYYLTNELGQDEVLSLLHDRPKAIKIGQGTNPAAEALALYRFMVEAGWYDRADKQLDLILKKYPPEKSHVGDLRRALKALQANQLYEDLQIAYKAGQHDRAQRILAHFPVKDVPAGHKALAGVGALRAKYEAANDTLRRARHYLTTLPAKVAAPADRAFFTTATGTILAEMNLDDFLPDATADKHKAGRLEPFLELAEQAERARKLHQTPRQSPEQLLSLAVSGWMLGKDSADAKPATSRKLWATRKFLFTYLTTADKSARKALRDGYILQASQYVGPEEVAHMLKLLPPIDAERQPPQTATELTCKVSSEARHELNYVIQLPPEYHPGRAYPLLIALHHAGEKPADMLKRCGPLAKKYGFILAAPAWTRLLDSHYGYTPEEHAAVTDLLVDVRRRFQVDSDRVFLLGYGEGACMAYDVGLAHPDLFAGVIPISGQPAKFAEAYWTNGQYLPFFVVDGQNSGRATIHSLKQFKHWITRGYSALHVIYRGRGVEWFAGELPDIFTWMSLQHRTAAGARTVPQLGDADNQFQTARETDNHFYWISVDSIDKRRLIPPDHYRSSRSPASLFARVGQNNEIVITSHGLRELSVWLSRDLMIDFDRPVHVILNGARRYHGTVKPNLAALLEDYYQRADRQRLYLARLKFDRL